VSPTEPPNIIIEDAALAQGFVQVPYRIFFDRDLRDGPVRVYGALLWYAWKQRQVPEQVAFAQELGMTDRTLRRHLTELEQAGYIAVVSPGLGQRSTYIIKSLMRPEEHPESRRTILSSLAGQNWPVQPDRIGRRLDKDLDSTTQTLSHSTPTPESSPTAADLAAEFLAALGEERPARQRRERAALIIHGLLQEGFDAATVRAATALAVARQARGPEVLPHLVGEAHMRTVAALRHEAATARTDQEQAQAAADRQARYDALDALPEEQLQELYAQGRAAMPYLGDGAGSQAALRAWAADRLAASNPSPTSP
jgi:hypothetical protein